MSYAPLAPTEESSSSDSPSPVLPSPVSPVSVSSSSASTCDPSWAVLSVSVTAVTRPVLLSTPRWRSMRHVRRFCFPWVRCFHSPKVAGLGIAAAGGAVSIPQRCDWKASFCFWKYRRRWISIPQRCDWKNRCPKASTPSPKPFQYLKGAIGRAPAGCSYDGSCCISIPQRCDWKTGAPRSLRFAVIISIPQRCDWKRQAVGRSRSMGSDFNTSKVRLEGLFRRVGAAPDPISIPQRCDWKERTAMMSRRARRISIPQRCDWKVIVGRASGTSSRFQYLKGAIGSTLPRNTTKNGGSNFNTSKVRLEVSYGVVK